MTTNGTPRTWFAGKSAPEDQKGPSAAAVMLVVMMLLSPISVFAAVSGYLTFTALRASYKVVAGATALYAVIWVLFGGLHEGWLRQYASPWRAIYRAVIDGNISVVAADQWATWLGAQAGFSVLLGGIAASAYSCWKWVRRPVWEDHERLPGPLDVLRRRLTIRAIKADEKGPRFGLTLGHDKYGHRVVQDDQEGSAHTLVAGGSGSGKSTTMMIGMRDVVRLGRGLVVVDLKGGPDVPAQLAEWAARYDRKFLHWSITDPRQKYTGPADGPAFYDPIGRGDPSRRKDLLIGSQKWGEEYYKTVVASYLQIAFNVADLVPSYNTDTFTDLVSLLNPNHLMDRATTLFSQVSLDAEGRRMVTSHGAAVKWPQLLQHVTDPDMEDLLRSVAETVQDMTDQERSAIRNMMARVQTLTRSTAGAWMKLDQEGQRNIDLRRAADEGWVVVFSLDSSNYEETSAQIAGLIIQDLKTLTSELRNNPSIDPFHVYVDEFAAVGSDNILGLLNKARDAKMPVMLSTQALADLKRADENFVDQVLAIVGCFIIHRANTQMDAEVFAGLTGKKMVFRKQYGIEMSSGMPGAVGTGAATGQGFIREDEEFQVLPSAFQALRPGQMVFIAKPVNRVEPLVYVIREDRTTVNLEQHHAPQRSVPVDESEKEKSGTELLTFRHAVESFDSDAQPSATAPLSVRRPIVVPGTDFTTPATRVVEPARRPPFTPPSMPASGSPLQPPAPSASIIDVGALRSRGQQPAQTRTVSPPPGRPAIRKVPQTVASDGQADAVESFPHVPATLSAPWVAGNENTDELGRLLPAGTYGNEIDPRDDEPSVFGDTQPGEYEWAASWEPADLVASHLGNANSDETPLSPEIPAALPDRQVSRETARAVVDLPEAAIVPIKAITVQPKTAVIYDENEW